MFLRCACASDVSLFLERGNSHVTSRIDLCSSRTLKPLHVGALVCTCRLPSMQYLVSGLQVLLKQNVQVLGLMDEQERTPLHVAAQAGHTDCIRVLLQYGAQAETVYAEYAEQSVPLASALHSAAASGNADALKMILAASGSSMVNAVDSFERTPLHLAASNGHVDCVEVWSMIPFLLSLTCFGQVILTCALPAATPARCTSEIVQTYRYF